MLNILAFDTATPDCLVVLKTADHVYEKMICGQKQHGKMILQYIDDLLQQAKLSLKDLHAIAFGCGPGSFTGIRLAASLAQGLSLPNRIPLIPISSLQLLAQSSQQNAVVSCIDARMETFYWGSFIKQNHLMEKNSDELASDFSVIKNFLQSNANFSFVTDQIETQTKIKTQFDVESHVIQITAKALLDLAESAYQKKLFVRAEDAIPNYLLMPKYKN